MAKLTWDNVGERFYEIGIDRVVLYTTSAKVSAWNGVVAINENPSGAEPNPVYADNIKYLNLMSAEEFKFTIEAYTYPEEFSKCIGRIEIAKGVEISQQKRKQFNLSYRTLIGNDEEGEDYGYKIHLVYGCSASPSSKDNSTINESPEATTNSWEVTTTPVNITGYKPAAHLIIDSSKLKYLGMFHVLEAIESILYGTDTTKPRVLLPEELVDICKKTMYLIDSKDDFILDSNGDFIQTIVYN